MAGKTIKKSNSKKEEVKQEEVVVETTPEKEEVVDNATDSKEAKVEVEVSTPEKDTVEVEDTKSSDETPNVEVEVEEDKTVEEKVTVDTSSVEFDKQAVHKNVRIRMRQDHRCTIGSEHYDLKKGQCYNVPVGVKKRLNKAGLLLPL